MLVMNIMEMMNPNGVTSKGDAGSSQNNSYNTFAKRLENAVAGSATFTETQYRVNNNTEDTVKNSQADNSPDTEEEKPEEKQYIPYVLIPLQTIDRQPAEQQITEMPVIDGADAVVEIGTNKEQIINAAEGEITFEAPKAQDASISFTGELIAEEVIEEQPKFTMLDTAVLKDSADTITDQIENEMPVIPERRPQGVSAAETQNTENNAAEILNLFESVTEETVDLTENGFVRQVLEEADAQLKNDAVTEGYKALETSSRPVIQNEQSNSQSQSGNSEGEDNTGRTAQPKQAAAEQPLNTAFTVNNNFETRLDSIAEAQASPNTSQAQNVRFQILEQVSSMISDNRQELTLQLKPHHLGGLTITLVQDQTGVTAKLVTASKDAHVLIQSEMVQMQEALRDKGIHVVEMEVIYDQMANTTGKGESDTGYNPQNGANAQHRGTSQGGLNLNTEEAAWMYEEMTGIEVLAEQGGSVEFSA